jgi:hypothetical protein
LEPLAVVGVLVPAVAGSCAVFVAVGLAAAAHWLTGGSARWLDFWFKEIGGPLLTVYAVVEMSAAAWVMRWYGQGEPLRSAWLLLSAAGGVHAASMFFRHWLAVPIAVNPLPVSGTVAWQPVLAEFGRVLGGTLYLLLLATGLTVALRVQARLGLLRRPSGTDWLALLGAAGLFTYTLHSLAFWLAAPGVRRTALWWIGWLTDPLLGWLLVLSVLVARAAAPLRGGLLARPWRAYFGAAALTCAGSFCVGLANSGLLPSQLLWPGWLAWHPAAALAALAPLLQLDAVRRLLLASQGGAAGEPQPAG